MDPELTCHRVDHCHVVDVLPYGAGPWKSRVSAGEASYGPAAAVSLLARSSGFLDGGRFAPLVETGYDLNVLILGAPTGSSTIAGTPAGFV
jgi:hypothetical protein